MRKQDCRGAALITALIAMAVAVIVMPTLLLLLHNTTRLATARPDNDEGLQARAELAEMSGSVDPIGACASPVSGTAAAYHDQCFRQHRVAGASLIETPALPAANPADYGACWLTTQEDDPNTPQDETEIRQRSCIVLEGDSDTLECSATPSGPCLRVLSESSEADGEPVLVDRHGGGLLLIRSWAETDSDTDPDTVPFLPHEWAEPPTDRLIYADVEWWCLRWRSPDGTGGVTPWTGNCPSPADPCERIPPPGTRWDSDWTAQTATWTASTTCPQQTPKLPDPAQAGHADPLTGILNEPHPTGDRTPLGVRITDVELLVCVASDYHDRLQGKPHCAVDRMRFNLADPHGWIPPVASLSLDAAVAVDGLTVTEGTTAGASFTVRLALQPSHDVTVTLTGPPRVTILPTTLTFTDADWDRVQTITVTAADDTDRNDEDVTLTLTTTSADADYDGLTTAVAVTVADDDKPDLIVNADSVSTTEGSTADITVRLQTSPAEAVTVAAVSDNPAAATVSPASLTFAAGTGQTAQTLTITGVDDPDIIHEAATITLTATSVGSGYDRLTETIAVTVIDDETPALIVSPDSVTVPESGTASVDVSLVAQPSDTVTVSIVSADAAAATASPASLTFTTGNWNTPQTVTISGTDDTDTNDDITAVSLSSTGGGYHSITASVAVTVTDDDMPGLSLSPDSVTVPEGTAATFDVSLAAQPSDTVTVTVTSADTAAATVAAPSLTFTTSDWNIPQPITVSGVDDPDFADETTTIDLSSSGGGYDGIAASVAVTVDDDEVCPPVGAPLAEYATADSVTITNRWFSNLAASSDPANNPIPVGEIQAFYHADGTTTFSLTSISSITINSVSNPTAAPPHGVRIPALSTDSKLVAVTFASPAGCTYTIPSP